MKKKEMVAIMTIIVILSFLVSCSEKTTEPIQGDNNGTLEFKMTVWNVYEDGKNVSSGKDFSMLKNDPNVYTCDIMNVRNILYEIQVADGEIIEGEPDDLDWITIYETSEMMLMTDREFSFVLPAGQYKAIRLLQSNRIYWITTYEDVIHEFPSLNNDEQPEDAQILDIFGEDGLYNLDENGLFYLYHDGERLGTFDIFPNTKTKVTFRMNLQTLDWIDHDSNGVWSDGDELSNWTVPEGVTTMADFIIEYEE